MFSFEPFALLVAFVSALGYVVLYVLLGAAARGPRAEYWELLRGTVLPAYDRTFLDGSDDYTAYQIPDHEYAGKLDLPPEAVEKRLWEVGFERMPLAAFKTTPDGRHEVGSWAYRERPLAERQLHVVLFRRPDGGTDMYAHDEYNALNPAVAHEHYRGVGRSGERGREMLWTLLGKNDWFDQ